MHFMIIRKADAATEAELPPAPGLVEAMARYRDGLASECKIGLTVALQPSAYGVRLALSPGEETITDGPFAQTAGLVGGFTLIEAASKQAAIEQLGRWPAIDAEATGELLLELREAGCPGGCAEVNPPAGKADEGDGHYVILLRSDAASERDAVPPQTRLDALDAFNLAQAEAGVLLAGSGLMASKRGARVRLHGGGVSVIDGPFAEAKELIAGFWMIRVRTMTEAIDWARVLPYPTGPEVEVEIRPVRFVRYQ